MALVKKWKELNKQHNEIIRFFNEVYGGPDVCEEDFALQPSEIAKKSRQMSNELDDIVSHKDALEREMSQEEYEETL